jgi:hypothetical protein
VEKLLGATFPKRAMFLKQAVARKKENKEKIKWKSKERETEKV